MTNRILANNDKPVLANNDMPHVDLIRCLVAYVEFVARSECRML